MNAVDTSVAVAAFGSWHAEHEAARAVVRKRPAIPVHAAFETYSVLTRLPPPNRADPRLVTEYLRRVFSDGLLQLSADQSLAALEELRNAGIAGGATYDGLIALTARAMDATLYTLDRRARASYERLGMRVRFVEQAAD